MPSTSVTYLWTPGMANIVEGLVGFGILLSECERYEVSLPDGEILSLTNQVFHETVRLWGDDEHAEELSAHVDRVLRAMLAASAVPEHSSG